GLRPFARPVIFGAIEPGRAHPVFERQIVGVANAQPALLGGVDQEQAAERPERLATQALLWLLVEDDRALAGVGDLGCGNQAGKACADDNDICVQGWSAHRRLLYVRYVSYQLRIKTYKKGYLGRAACPPNLRTFRKQSTDEPPGLYQQRRDTTQRGPE